MSTFATNNLAFSKNTKKYKKKPLKVFFDSLHVKMPMWEDGMCLSRKNGIGGEGVSSGRSSSSSSGGSSGSSGSSDSSGSNGSNGSNGSIIALIRWRKEKNDVF